jgi:hypothetical protein
MSLVSATSSPGWVQLRQLSFDVMADPKLAPPQNRVHFRLDEDLRGEERTERRAANRKKRWSGDEYEAEETGMANEGEEEKDRFQIFLPVPDGAESWWFGIRPGASLNANPTNSRTGHEQRRGKREKLPAERTKEYLQLCQ